MKALLICPADRFEVAALAESAPLSNLPILGKPLIEYWLEHLAQRGAKEVCILATDRPEQVRTLVADGARWGLRVEVLPELREPTPAEAREKFGVGNDDAAWLAAPDDIQVMDHLPGLPDHPLFASYAGRFAATMAWMPHAATPDRIGLREVKPGVWAGLRARIAPEATLHAPCWIGEDAYVAPETVVGPNAVIENRAFVAHGAEVTESVVGPDTLVGEWTEVRHSLVHGNLLIHWELDSCIRVAEPFLISKLGRRAPAFDPLSCLGRLAAFIALLLGFPFALVAAAISKLQGVPVWRRLVAMRPVTSDRVYGQGDMLVYYELRSGGSWMRRWPQLWNIVRGDFKWIGNRPLSPNQAARLRNDYERLWLQAPLGLISLADVEERADFRSDETRAHSSYYAAAASWRLDCLIFARAAFMFLFGVRYSRVRDYLAAAIHAPRTQQREVQGS